MKAPGKSPFSLPMGFAEMQRLVSVRWNTTWPVRERSQENSSSSRAIPFWPLQSAKSLIRHSYIITCGDAQFTFKLTSFLKDSSDCSKRTKRQDLSPGNLFFQRRQFSSFPPTLRCLRLYFCFGWSFFRGDAGPGCGTKTHNPLPICKTQIFPFDDGSHVYRAEPDVVRAT